MGLFRRKEKEYTLGQILNLMQKDTEGKYHDYIPVPTRPGSKNTTYWFRKEERDEKDGQQVINYRNGNTISGNGKYVLTARDEFGNETTVSFEIRTASDVVTSSKYRVSEDTLYISRIY